MEKNDFIKIMELHKLACKLKNLLRSGWLAWKLEGVRLESVAEHIFGTCMLAVGIYSTLKPNIDIDKAIVMLMLHETEEILIGDITLIDKEYKNKQELGRQAVLEVFKDFKYANHFLELIAEFEANSTPEARFANQCDKFEADLQAYYYRDNFNLDKVEDRLKEDSRILAMQEKGYKCVEEYFLQNDKIKYDGIFAEMTNYLEELEKKN